MQALNVILTIATDTACQVFQRIWTQGYFMLIETGTCMSLQEDAEAATMCITDFPASV